MCLNYKSIYSTFHLGALLHFAHFKWLGTVLRDSFFNYDSRSHWPDDFVTGKEWTCCKGGTIQKEIAGDETALFNSNNSSLQLKET